MPTAILLDTDQLEGDLAGRAPAPGLLPLAGRPLVSYAARALRACGDIDRLVLAGPPAYQAHTQALAELDHWVLVDGPPVAVVEAALDQVRDEELVVCPANAPLLRTEMVEQLLRHAPEDAGLTWAVVREERLTQAFPDGLPAPRHNLAGVTYCLTRYGVAQRDAIEAHWPMLRRILSGEVGSSELVKLMGMGFAIKYGAGRAHLDELVQRLGDALGLACVVEVLPYAELLLQVRTRQDHHLARAILEAE